MVVHKTSETAGQRGTTQGGAQMLGGGANVRQMHEHIGRLVDHLLIDVGLTQLVAGQRRSATRAVGHHLDVLVEEALVPEVLQVPPHRFDVLGREGPVGVVDVDPVADALGQRLPLVHIVPHRLAAQPGELGHPHLFLDLVLGGDPELLLDLDLDREAMGVPARLARHGESPHGAVAAEEVLVHPGPDVVKAGAAVGSRRPLVEDPGLGVLPGLDGAFEDAVLPPSDQLLGFEDGEVGFGGNRGEQRLIPLAWQVDGPGGCGASAAAGQSWRAGPTATA